MLYWDFSLDSYKYNPPADDGHYVLYECIVSVHTLSMCEITDQLILIKVKKDHSSINIALNYIYYSYKNNIDTKLFYNNM